jgi:hypothetical protein
MARLRLPLVLSLVLHVGVGVFAARGVHLTTPPAAASSTATLSGETFDVPDEEPLEFPAGGPAAAGHAETRAASANEANEANEDREEVAETHALAAPLPRAKRSRPVRGHAGPAIGAAPGEGGDPHAPPALYGAAGERGAVDLATAFTRGFPQAASTDSRWIQAPFGSAGEALLVLDISPAGSLTGHSVSGNPSAALRAGIERTIALIGAREFTSRGASTRLRIAATVSPDQVHDGLHGDVFAIGGSFAQAEGSGFFALAIGRRIDVRVRAMP